MFIRQIEVYIGREPDNVQQDISSAVAIISRGRQTDLEVAIKINKTSDSTPNTAEIVILNLNQETQTIFSGKNTFMEVRCGWLNSDTGILTCHKGGIKMVNTEGQRTTISSVDGASYFEFSTTNRSYAGKESLQRVVEDLASDMGGIAQSKIELKGNLGFKGRHFSGSTRDQLNALAHQFGFTWSIQNAVFSAFMDDSSSSRLYTFNDEVIELIKPNKGSDGTNNGFSMRSYLDPRINGGDLIKIDSKIKPEFNGTYVVTKHVLSGSTFADGWNSDFEMARQQ